MEAMAKPTGGYHLGDGLFFHRSPNGVRIVKMDSAKDGASVVFDMTIDAESWHSMLAATQQTPPADDAHVAIGSRLFSDPTRVKEDNVPSQIKAAFGIAQYLADNAANLHGSVVCTKALDIRDALGDTFPTLLVPPGLRDAYLAGARASAPGAERSGDAPNDEWQARAATISINGRKHLFGGETITYANVVGMSGIHGTPDVIYHWRHHLGRRRAPARLPR